ncbi:amidase [Ramlibacter albus]|uniref:Indole acetimide hydrolase n=1 Tax=Ramlibacter albus TaxID=2079448 RepID=A0A923S2U3_9BURK|nr:amidase [Ramlibacter albus]MBC5765755.1 indole acetimide hydrolase [Ramlibacter albus]
MQQPWRESAQRLARLIKSREISSAEVVEAHLARIDEVNPRLNAIVKVLAEPARAAARAADEAVARGDALGPLHGVPFTAKENVDVAGLPTTWGVKALAQAVASMDAPVVERMKRAGAVLIGRTNLPDMGLRLFTESSLYGVTRNPWSPERTAGGSSGGEAASIATGMSPLGLGNDLGGSLRNPANCCGIASIKPSAGRVPHAALIPAPDRLMFVQMMAVEGPMARTVGDVRIALQALMGAHPRDPLSVSVPFEGEPVAKPLRVAFMPRPPGAPCDDAVVNAARRAADALSNAGYEVVEVAPPCFEETLQLWAAVLGPDLGVLWPKMSQLVGPVVKSMMQAFVEHAGGPDAIARLPMVFARRDAVAREWSQFMATHPLLLTPTWNLLPPKHGGDLPPAQLAPSVLPANLLGLPSACVPASRDDATGLPVGVLLTGARFREDLCLAAAEVVEASAGVVTPTDPHN